MSDPLRQSTKNLRILPLGGCGEFGMNLTCYIHNGKLAVVDAGVMFPDPWRLGVEAYIPDVSFVFDQFETVSAYFITHGHEDHIGALPFLYTRWPAPVYATPYTKELIRNKLQRLNRDPDSIPIEVVETGSFVKQDSFQVHYLAVNHSLPDAAALVIEGQGFRVVHTGDFKVDPKPLYDAPMKENDFRAFGDKGVDMMLVDSTNGHKSGRCPGEDTVLDPLYQEMKDTKGCVFLTTFSSNLWRLMSVIEVARRAGRKVFVAGWGMDTTITTGKKTGLYRPPDNVIIEAQELTAYNRDELCILISGCQAEYRSGLVRLASGEHRDVHVEPGDRVIFSSRIIPGNERAIFSIMDRLKKQGAEIVTTRENPGIHVSGHAHQEDIQVLAEWVRPKYFVPVHGSFTHLAANRGFADSRLTNTESIGIENGTLLELTKSGIQTVEQYQMSYLYIDSETHVPLDFDTMRGRHRIGELGGIWISGVYSQAKKAWLRGPHIDLSGIGLPAHLDPSFFFDSTKKAIMEATSAEVQFGKTDEESLREEIRIAVRRHVGAMLGKKPVVLSLVSLV